MHKTKILNALSVDVEDYFHVEAFAAQISPKDWQKFEPRVEKNIELILEILANHQTAATFFVLGWVTENFPHLVRQIAEAGHEIGCHGYAHQHIQRQTPDQFRQDVRKARQLLIDLSQQPVVCYRAPSYSVTEATLWALDILAEEGFKIDSSIFPIRHDLYGIPDGKRFAHWRNEIFEFPPSTVRLAGNNFGIAGGGYLRLLPYGITKWAIRQINQVEGQPAMVYFHPWELDPDQPQISATLRSQLRHYTNLRGMQKKIKWLLRDFRFSTVSEVCKRIATDFTDSTKNSFLK